MTALIDQLTTKLRNSKLIAASSWYVISTFAQKAILFLAIPVITRLLTTDQYGTVALYATWASVFLIVLPLNTQASGFRAWFDYENKHAAFTASVLVLGTLTSILGLAILWVLPAELVFTIFNLEKPFVVAAGFSALFVFPQKLVMSGWQAAKKHRHFATASFLIVAFSTLLSIGLLLLAQSTNIFGDPTWARILGLLIVAMIAWVVFFGYALRGKDRLFNSEFWRYSIAYSAPLIAHLLSAILLSQFDRVMINAYVGRAESGIYSFAYQIGEMVFMLWTATHMAWQPWFYDRMKEQDYPAIRHKSIQYQGAFTLLTVGIIVAGVAIVPFIAPETYWGATSIIPLIMIGGFFRFLYTFYLHIELEKKRTAYVSIGTLIAAAINVGLNLWLLPIYGYEAAAWATLIAYAVLFLLHAAIVRFRLKVRGVYNFPFMVGMATLVTIVGVVVYLLA